MDIEELRVTAALAHIVLDEAALKEAFPAFEQMLDFFKVMSSAEADAAIGEAAEADRPIAESAWFRPDDVDGEKLSTPEIMIAKAGESDGRFMVIPNVL